MLRIRLGCDLCLCFVCCNSDKSRHILDLFSKVWTIRNFDFTFACKFALLMSVAVAGRNSDSVSPPAGRSDRGQGVGTRMEPRRSKVGRSALAATVLVLVIQTSAPAFAQVLDIDEHGSVVVFNGPTQYLSPDIRDGRVIPRAGRRSSSSGPGGRGAARQSSAGAAPGAAVSAAIGAAALQQNLDPALITAVARTESGLNSRAVSAKGAVGVMQLMPGTAQALGVDPTDPADNVRGGAAYLRQLLRRYDGDIIKALAAYNAGPGAVDRHNGAPQYRETQGYITAVLERMAQSVVPVPPPTASRNRRP